MLFLPVLYLTSDSLTTIQIEPNWCLSHQYILLHYWPNPWNFSKNIESLSFWKTQFFFESAIMVFFPKKTVFFFFIPIKISQVFLCSKDWSKFWWLSWFPAKKTHSKHVNWLFTISKSMDDMEWHIFDCTKYRVKKELRFVKILT